MSETTRAILTALYAAIVAVLPLPLTESTRRQLNAARLCLARDLGMPEERAP